MVQANDLACALSSHITPHPGGAMVGQNVSHYQITEQLGQGGMGVVYKAEDIRLERTVALKFLPVHVLPTGDDKARFYREAKAAAKLNHPNIAHVYEIDETDDGRAFIAMEYIEGQMLEKKIEQGPLPIDEAVGIAEQMAEGLAAAHQGSIIHRDIKPANVIVTEAGVVKIVDFGVAKGAGLSLTQTGTTLGTVAYMSPEQARGDSVDGRTDLWSLGVVLYEMLTKQRPFRGDYPQAVIYSILNESPVPVGELREEAPEALEQVVEKLLQKDPAERYQDANALLADLRACRHGDERSTQRVGRPGPAKRRRLVALGLAGLILLLVGLGRLVWQRAPTSTEEATPAERATASVAVLPLENVSDDAEQEFFADGITEELINTLSRISALRVISFWSTRRYKNANPPLPEVADQLDVDFVIHGAAWQSEQQIRLRTNLAEATTDTPLWRQEYAGQVSGVKALLQEAALAIAQQIEVTLTAQDRERLEDAPAVDPEAFQLYLRGAQARHLESESEAVNYFERAIAHDSTYAQAHAGLAGAYAWLGYYAGLEEGEEKARRHLKTALSMDPTLSEAYAAKGMILEHYDGDFAGAEEAFRIAIHLNPNDAFAHLELGNLLMRQRRFDEALREVQQALYLNPLSARFQNDVGAVLHFSGRYDEAIDAAEKALALDASLGSAYGVLGSANTQQGQYEVAIEAYENGIQLGCGWCLGNLGYVYAVSGRRAEAQEILGRLEEQWREGAGDYDVAMIYAGLGEREQALDWLERFVEEIGVPLYLGIDPAFDSLHSEPRFESLLEKVGLDP
jgi:serine/threonine protein kinase/Flp pilus assembly protein TadD